MFTHRIILDINWDDIFVSAVETDAVHILLGSVLVPVTRISSAATELLNAEHR